MAQLPRSRAPDLDGAQIRTARAADHDDLLAMWKELLRLHGALHPSYRLGAGGDAALSEALSRELRDPQAVVLVASPPDGAGTPAGFGVAHWLHAPVDGAEPAAVREGVRGSIDELWVAPAARRGGVGRRLVGAALAALEAAGAARVEVRVLHANRDAQAFWRALGFAPFVDVLERRVQRD